MKFEVISKKTGNKLVGSIYQPKATPRAVIFFQHGVNEHCKFHVDRLFIHLQEIGCVVVAHDHAGHGLSSGLRGYVAKFATIVSDSHQVIEEVSSSDWEGLPRFVYGFSMGGAVAIHLVLDSPKLFDGMILAAPLTEVDPSISGVSIALIKALSLVTPKAKVYSSPLELETSDEVLLNELKSDELLNHEPVRARSLRELLRAGTTVVKRKAEISLPVLVLHGEADTVTRLQGSRNFVDGISSKDKKLVSFPDMLHYVDGDVGREDAIRETVQWLDERAS